MSINKAEMQSELKEFIVNFGASISRMYGGVPYPNPMEHAHAKAEDTTLWNTVDAMFDFGVHGIPGDVMDLGDGESLDAGFADAEMFLRGLKSLETYLEEDDCKVPRLAVRTARTAIARHVLEGGDRWTYFEGDGGVNLLTFEEMAFLADMDERSVRNAANPKVTDPLVTIINGKRTYIEPKEAKRWLANRKGFVPTQSRAAVGDIPTYESKAILRVAQVTLQKLQAVAMAEGVSVDEVLARLLP